MWRNVCEYRGSVTTSEPAKKKSNTGSTKLADLLTVCRLNMSKRVPPWERARINFARQERERLRKLEVKQRPVREQVLDLEENRKRLAQIKDRLVKEEGSTEKD